MDAETLERLAETYPGMLQAEGFEDCIIGVAHRACNEPVLAYDRSKCIQKLMDRDGMEREEAEEFFEFNTLGAWVGERTPIFIETEV
jgi:hypothetical protein